MPQPVIIITGANGQLGKELQQMQSVFLSFQFHFMGRDTMPVDQPDQVRKVFEELRPDYLVNCAAYTAVDKAEAEKDAAFQINAEAVGLLAELCKEHNTKFIHISTDYVFDGSGSTAYQPHDTPNPLSVYGASKLEGERLAMAKNPNSVIIRTSWVYSSFGNNFVKTMMRLMKDRPALNVVSDQFGSPTYAADLAEGIMDVIAASDPARSAINPEQVTALADGTGWFPGIYHFSNEAEISWFDFAVAIKEIIGSDCAVSPIPTASYPTPAKRPMYSLMDKTAFVSTFDIPLKPWKESLHKCIALLQ